MSAQCRGISTCQCLANRRRRRCSKSQPAGDIPFNSCTGNSPVECSRVSPIRTRRNPQPCQNDCKPASPPKLVPSESSSWLRQNSSARSEEHTSELQSRPHLVCRLLLEKKKQKKNKTYS